MSETPFIYTNASGDPGAAGGPLGGMRLAVQPNLCVRGWPTEAGSKALENYKAIEDATVVERLRKAGASLAGSVGMGELGFGLAGDTAAQAVAQSHCDAVIVTDAFGEARVAAAEAGIFGYKPSSGIVSRYGLIGLIPSMECLGVVAREPAQAARIMTTMAGPDPRDFSLGAQFPDFSTPPPAGGAPVVGVIAECMATLEPAENAALQEAIERMKKAGFKATDVSIPDFELFRLVHQVGGSVEASSSAGKYDSVRYGHRAAKSDNWNEMYLKSRCESFGVLTKAYLFQGAYVQFSNYPAFENACRIRRRLVDAVTGLLGQVDVLALPTRKAGTDARTATNVSAVYDAFAHTLPANVAGLPAVSIPGYVAAGGTDLGLQLVGRRLDDTRLLAMTAQLFPAPTGGR